MTRIEDPRLHSRQTRRPRPGRFLLLVVLGYLMMGVLLTLPTILKLHTRILGMVGVENLPQTIWLYAQLKLHLAAVWTQGEGHGFLVCLADGFRAALCYPRDVVMANGLDFIFNPLLEAGFGFPAYYNLKAILILALNGLGAYLLAARLAGNRPAALAAGALFMVNPYFLYCLSVGRMMEATAFWIPLCLWQGHLFWNDGWWRSAILAGLFLGLAASSYWFYGYFLLIFAAAFLLAAVGRAWKEKGGLGGKAERSSPWAITSAGSGRLLLGWILGMLVALVVVLPLASPYLELVFNGERIPGLIPSEPSGRAGDRPSVEAMQLVTDSCNLDYLVRKSPIGSPYDLPSRGVIPLSLVLISLIPILIFAGRPRFWLAMTAIFLVLPLGPYLKHQGQLLMIRGEPVPLPYLLLYRELPLFDKLFWPSQALVFTSLLLAILAGMGLARILALCRGNLLQQWSLVILVVMAVMLEVAGRGAFPISSSPLVVPEFYTGLIRARGGGVIDLPANLYLAARRDGDPNPNFYYDFDRKLVNFAQVFHQQPTLWGQSRVLDPKERMLDNPRYLDSNRFLASMLSLEAEDSISGDGFGKDDPTPAVVVRLKPFNQKDLDEVTGRGFRYLVLHERFCSHHSRAGYYQFDPAYGKAYFDAALISLEKALGHPASHGVELTWEQSGWAQYRKVPSRVVVFSLP